MNKIIGYGASLLFVAGACGLLFGVSQAEAGDRHHDPPGAPEDDGKDKCDKLCECLEKVLDDIKYAERNGAGKVKHADKVVDDVEKDLERCVEKFCDKTSCDQ
ncbi:hypothetical protein WME75_21925 [Sorangium sp. So ce1014]|uniref:hypothetical protein n=1 Tax=Sorangium sp. So ce1014 TaxID=3133326 RepID=UPI003F61A481